MFLKNFIKITTINVISLTLDQLQIIINAYMNIVDLLKHFVKNRPSRTPEKSAVQLRSNV